MPKNSREPRTQRTKKKDKDKVVEDDENPDINYGDDLSDNHTIADSVGTGYSMEEDEIDGDGNVTEVPDDLADLLLEGKGRVSDQAEAAAEARFLKLQEALNSMHEFATEKRSAKREQRLKRLFRALSQHATGPSARDLVVSSQDSLRMACLFSLRQGSASEQYAACRVLEVMSVVLGANQEEWVESVAKYFERAIQVTTRAAAVRSAALRAWAMTVFICDASTEGPTTERLMDFCEEAAKENFRNETTPMALRATALDAWALLATTIEDVYLADQDDVHIGRGLVILELLSDCLDSPSVELRTAAGECMSLIHEARLNCGLKAEDTENTTEKKYSRGSWEGSAYEEIMDQVKQRVAELSVDATRTLSKKARKEQRATFREFVSTIVDDESPEEVTSFRNGAQLSLSTWREIIQLNFCRHCLQSGFQIQLLTNETLQDIFGADSKLLNSDGGLSQLEKRLYMSKGSEAAKEAHVDMTRQRDKRQNVKNHFLTVDGEDI